MKKTVVLSAVLLAAAIAWWRTAAQPARPLAGLMPAGALLYLEASDFSSLLREWNTSKVKSNWLASANYQVFSRSNLLIKLSSLYGEYGEAAGFAPDLKSVASIAGSRSALALYEIRNAEFLYVTELPRTSLTQSELWGVRDKFGERQSAGLPFYVRTAGGRTVAFAFADEYLFLGTREDLVAQALALFAGAKEPSVASARWYQETTRAAAGARELRMVLNLDSLVKSTHFRSYWVHRNVSDLRQYSAGIADVNRDPRRVTEHRVLVRERDVSTSAPTGLAREALARLASIAPADAGLYKGWAAPAVDFTAALIEAKLLAPKAQPISNLRFAPVASSTGEAAGTEADLETRIDEPALPAGVEGALVSAPLQKVLERAGPQALLQIQASRPMPNGFIATPCVLVIAAAADWDPNAVRESLTASIETLWTTSRLGAQWTPARAGNHAVERLNGLVPLVMTIRGGLLYLANDADLLASVLDRPTAPASASRITYTAAFRHSREAGNYHTLMDALDYTNAPFISNQPRFFSQNLSSLSQVLSFVTGVQVTASDRGRLMEEQVVYTRKP